MKLHKYLTEANKSVTFVRFGGLSKVNQKKFGIHPQDGSESFHRAPVKKGIYAFIWPYIEDFLWAWNVKYSTDPNETEEESKKTFNKYIKAHRKKFQYNGFIWTHFTGVSKELGRRRIGSWVEIHTNDLMFLLKKQKHMDMKQIMGSLDTIGIKNSKNFKDIKDPYKRGLGGFISRDHLEVFIEKVN